MSFPPVVLAVLSLVIAAVVAYALRHQIVRLARNPVIDLFHYFYYRDSGVTWSTTQYMGVPLQKLPMDLWRYNDILWETHPDLIIEAGTNRGGSALFFAHQFDLLGRGRIVTVDLHAQPALPQHPRITYLNGSSTDPQTFAQVTAQIRGDERVMVVLDSDHSRDHVKRELELYSPLVSKECYLVVEDSNVNGHPVFRSHGPGPMEAMDIFPWANAGFQRDDQIEQRYMVTFFPRGWLKRVAVGNSSQRPG
jgi:cephalosporin hydroxylase